MKLLRVGRLRTAIEIEQGGDDNDQESGDREQIDLPRVMTVGADFPAHCFLPEEHRNNALGNRRFPKGSNAACS